MGLSEAGLGLSEAPAGMQLVCGTIRRRLARSFLGSARAVCVCVRVCVCACVRVCVCACVRVRVCVCV